MALLIRAGREPVENWIESFAKAFPDLECRVWPEVGDPADIEYVLANQLPEGTFATFPNLKLVAGTRVGLEGLLNDPSLPRDVPIIRNTDRERAATMTGWVLYQVLRHHRRFDEREANQRAIKWEHLQYTSPEQVRIGIMGLGSLGASVARALQALMYSVAGWSRSHKDIPGIESFAGDEEMAAFLGRTDILISILPQTPATTDLMNAKRFAQLPKGAYVINCGRGSLIDEDALLAAIDSGHLEGAALDVFKTEPLPADHPFWRHPKIAVSPHYSCSGRARYGAEGVVAAIRAIRAGHQPENIVERTEGY
jgi:glyoxylate/hydroxypyruvate reductase A